MQSPAQPAVLSTVLLGENYSWSEVSGDDKALAVLPDLGLVLVPYEGGTTNGWASEASTRAHFKQIIALQEHAIHRRPRGAESPAPIPSPATAPPLLTPGRGHLTG